MKINELLLIRTGIIEVEGLLLFNGLSLDFREQVEVRIEVLAIVLIRMHANLVVMGGAVLPLKHWLDVQQLHEGVKLNLVVLDSHGLVVYEESVLLWGLFELIIRNGVLILVLFILIGHTILTR